RHRDADARREVLLHVVLEVVEEDEELAVCGRELEARTVEVHDGRARATDLGDRVIERGHHLRRSVIDALPGHADLRTSEPVRVQEDAVVGRKSRPAAAAAEPELEPQALRSVEYGLCVRPPRPDQPLVEKKERKLAHSERFVLPRITAPAARRFAATVESLTAGLPSSASDPAVVCILSPVSMLSLSRIGIPSSGPMTLPFARRLSASCAS